jgi:hypothetical protein
LEWGGGRGDGLSLNFTILVFTGEEGRKFQSSPSPPLFLDSSTLWPFFGFVKYLGSYRIVQYNTVQYRIVEGSTGQYMTV